MSVIQNNLLLADEGYNLTRSLRFRSSASAYLNRTPASAGSQTTWTWSGWVKRGLLGSGTYRFFNAKTGNASCVIGFGGSADSLQFAGVNSSSVIESNLVTTQVFRDPSSWYHVVAVYDSTNATASNRLKLYVNGSQITAFGTATYPAQNTTTPVNSAVSHTIGMQIGVGEYLDGYLAEVNFIDGQALTPSSFGQTSSTTGVWQPKKYTGTYGTNGFYLPFTDNSALTSGSNAGLGKDFSGNGNYWNTNNISITSGSTYDSMTDVPTLTNATTANFAVLNPIDNNTAGSLRWGNLDCYGTSVATGIGSIWITSGKWYAEATIINRGGTSTAGTGFYISTASGITRTGLNPNGTRRIDGVDGTALSAAIANNDVIGLSLDADAKTLGVYLNGSLQGTLTFTDSAPYTFNCDIRISGSTTNPDTTVNFGQQPWKYTPPTGYLALNTYNLPTPTIGATSSSRANKYMDVSLYTGNGSTNTITNAGGFQPDFVWNKDRSNASSHALFDSVRGVTKELYSNLTDAEGTASGVTSFNSNGYTVGSNTRSNANGSSFVGWQWKANGSGSTNTAGSITSTVSANTTSGFSIVTYTGGGTGGLTVGHGLGVAPKMIIVKSRTSTNVWSVYHASLGNTKYMLLNATDASATSSGFWNNTTPSSTVFTVGTDFAVNQGSINYVAYCFAEVAGFSKFGSYTGNGSTNGTFVYTGFRPKYVMVKRTDTAGYSWIVLDSARDPYNVASARLIPNTSDAEASGTHLEDFLSNGFKLRGTSLETNASAGSYIFMAFAENPFKYSLAR